MNILQTVKYYHPSKGGMESVVKDIVDGISVLDTSIKFTTYANSHTKSYVSNNIQIGNVTSIKARTPLILKSQPLNLFYPGLKKLIKESDVIHHHYPFPNMELALLRNISLLKNKKLIITWHANIKTSRWSWIAKFYDPIIKRLLDIASHIVVTSPQLIENSDFLKDYKHKIKVIPLSFDPALSKRSTPRKYPIQRQFNLLFVGKLREYKGITYLISAIQNLDVLLTIVGEGENEHQLKKLTTELGIERKVFFKKGLSNNELYEAYKLADLFILPSINEAEAFGVVQLEAMANGLPVINTLLNSGVPFVSLQGITGETVAPGDTKALELGITKIINDPNLYETYSINAIERVSSFSRTKMATQYRDLYFSGNC